MTTKISFWRSLFEGLLYYSVFAITLGIWGIAYHYVSIWYSNHWIIFLLMTALGLISGHYWWKHIDIRFLFRRKKVEYVHGFSPVFAYSMRVESTKDSKYSVKEGSVYISKETINMHSEEKVRAGGHRQRQH